MALVNKGTLNVGTTATVVSDVVPASTAHFVLGLFLSNKLSTQITVTVVFNDGTKDHVIVQNMPIPVGGAQVPIEGTNKFLLTTGDSLKVTCSDASACDAVLAYATVAN